MPKQILDVGQCDMDHDSIRRLIQQHFTAEVVRAHSAEETIDALRRTSFDLVLVNRILDRDQSDGLQIVRRIKNDRELADVAVMLVTNYREHQETAVSAGAEPGFGKAALDSEATRRALQRVLDR